MFAFILSFLTFIVLVVVACFDPFAWFCVPLYGMVCWLLYAEWRYGGVKQMLETYRERNK